jgi:hypothetical protein
MKSIVSWQTIFSFRIQDNDEMLVTDKGGCDKIGTHRHFSEDTAYAALFREVFSINCQNLIKRVRAAF